MPNQTQNSNAPLSRYCPLITGAPTRFTPIKRVGTVVLLTALSMGGISGCSQPHESYQSSDMAVTDSYEEDASLEELSSAPLQVADVTQNTEQTLDTVAANVKVAGKTLIITVNAIFKVDDVVESNKAIDVLTRQQGGYVASSAINNRPMQSQTFTQDGQDYRLITYKRESHMIVRVPSEQINDFLSQLQKQVKFLEFHEFKAEDVTLDIKRERLAAALDNSMADKLSEERLDSEDADEQSSNVDSIVATYDAKRRAQYAKLQQMQIEDRVKYSTVELTFSEPPLVFKERTDNLDTIVQAYEPSFFTQAGAALSKGWGDLKIAIIGILRLWWLWLLLISFALTFKALKKAYHYVFKSHTKAEK